MDTSKETIKKLYFEQIREITRRTCMADRFNFELDKIIAKT